MTKIAPTDPNQFACDACGRVFNQTQKEPLDGAALCTNCYEEKTGEKPPSLIETRIRKVKEAALAKAQKEYDDAVDAEKAAIEKAVPVQPEGEPVLTETDATAGAMDQMPQGGSMADVNQAGGSQPTAPEGESEDKVQ